MTTECKTLTLPEKYADQVEGVLSCYDRLIVTGSVQPLCYAKGMTHYLSQAGIRVFDFAMWAQPKREEIRANAAALAQANGLTIEFIRKRGTRKEERINTLLKQRGEQPGLVHIFAAMERCNTYEPWHDKVSGKTYVRYSESKCLHYYFYFIDAELGLCYLRVPTWAPFRLQFYCNGHAWLAHQLQQRGIAYTLRDNAFTHVSDYAQANALADGLDPQALHALLDRVARQYCPVIASLGLMVTWSLMQAEYATDIVFKSRADLQALYPHLVETLIHTVKPEDVATFLGRKLHGAYTGEVTSGLNKRILGTRIKHVMGPASIKLYDKFGHVLRIETTTNDVSFFPQYRQVQHRDGTHETQWTTMKKTIYSLAPLREVMVAANRRYLDLISSLERPDIGVAGTQQLTRLTRPQVEGAHRYTGFNPLADEDVPLFRLLLRGEFTISGLTNRAVRALLPGKTVGQVSRLLKRLRVHGLIKKVGHRYKYYLTEFGQRAASLVLKLRELAVIPYLAGQPAL
ncbi:MAG: MarR family transcriptional regulator [Chloroflexi bacterium]|nr:MarR family transcriptional regulator [Chloroflexota bacterium]